MRIATAVTVMVLLGLSGAHSWAGGDDPIAVVPQQGVITSDVRNVYIAVAALDTPAGIRTPRASLIAYAPDGTMLRPRAKLMRNSGAIIRVILPKPAPVGTYTVYGTVEVDDAAFGVPSTFDVAP